MRFDLVDEPPEVYRMLCRFTERDAERVTFTDLLPPFGLVEIPTTMFEALGEPRELRVTFERTELS